MQQRAYQMVAEWARPPWWSPRCQSVRWVLLMSPDPTALHMSFTICHRTRAAKKKKTQFLSFIPSSSFLPSEVKGTLWRSCSCFFFFFLPYHPLSFSSLSLPSLHHLSPRPCTLLMIEISQVVKGLSELGLLRCSSGHESVSVQTRTQLLWLSEVVWSRRPKSSHLPPSTWLIPDFLSGMCNDNRMPNLCGTTIAHDSGDFQSSSQ